MGWKLFLIVITNANNVNVSDVPQKLGFSSLKPTKEISIHEAQSAKGISIGKYEDKIFIVAQDLVSAFYEENPTTLEKRLCEAFPNSEIAVLSLYSVVDLYGYCIIFNGKRQRVKSGADLESYFDCGSKLPEELEIAKEKLFEDRELKEIYASQTKENAEIFLDQERSIRTTFRLTARYFKEQIDKPGSDFEKIKVTLYQ